MTVDGFIKMASVLDDYGEVILRLLQEGRAYSFISDHLCNLGVLRGSSEANIRKFCADNRINPRVAAVSDSVLDLEVSNAVRQVSFIVDQDKITSNPKYLSILSATLVGLVSLQIS